MEFKMIKLSKNSEKALKGCEVVEVGDDYIVVARNFRHTYLQLDEEEIKALNECFDD